MLGAAQLTMALQASEFAAAPLGLDAFLGSLAPMPVSDARAASIPVTLDEIGNAKQSLPQHVKATHIKAGHIGMQLA